MFVNRWSQYILRLAQYLRTHRDVLLLHGGSYGPQIPEVHLVEEVPHRLPDGKYILADSPYHQ